MKTEVIMKRELFGEIISQKSKSEFFSATDLTNAGNKWRVNNGKPFFNMNKWFQSKTTKEFMCALENKYGKVKINSTGKNRHTWIHPFLFIDLALAISPELKIEVYSWLYDYLIKYRNDSGDSYKRMAGAIYKNSNNKSKFTENIKLIANTIKEECKVENWETATQEQLELRDKMHDNISLVSDILPDIKDILRISMKKAIEAQKNKGVKNDR